MPATSSQRNESRNSPERLQRTFLLYSVFAVLIACLVVSAAAVFPVVNQYAAHEEDEILHALQLRTLAIREFLTGAREIANQIGSRTKARQALDAYERGETDLDTLRAFTRPILADAIERSAQVAGITRLDARGAIVVSLGVAVPGELHYRALPASDSPEFRGPTTINGRPYTLVANPIFETAGRRLGADLLLIDATALKRIVEDPIGLRRTGASALGALRGGKMEIFCAYDSTTSSLSAAVLATESGLGAGLEGNPDSNSGTSSTEDANGRSVVVTYSRIPDTDWIAIVSIDKSELYEGLSQQLRLMGFVVIPLVVIGLLVMLRILKPLIARMNAHAAVLRGEIEERKRAEAEALLRADQQAVVAELGQHAFRGLPKSEMMDRVVAALASTLNVEFVKVLELMADGQSLLLRAGVGWREGLVGRARVATARDSQAGYTLLSDGPVVVEDHASEKRFSGPLLLQEHGIRSGASVLIRGRKGPFGVLGVHSRGLRRFTSHDLNFIQTVANLLGETVERTEAESALAENEMRLRAVFASALDPIIITNADGIVQAASDSVERCFGWHPRETLGKSIDRLFYEGFHREYQQNPDSPLPEEESGLLGHTREIVALRNDGSSFPCEISVSRVTLPGQAGTLFTTIIRDITERRRSEEQRRQLVELIEHSPDLIGLASIEGKALYVNRAGREMVGLGPAAEVKRTTLSDYILPEDRSEFSNSVLSRVISGGGYVEKEFRLRNFMTGEAIPAQGKLFLIKDSATGEPVALATVTSDIRSRKKAEADLRASEALFRQFVESLPLGIVVHCDGQIVYANLSAARLVGEARAEDLLGRAVIEFIHPEDHHRSRARIRAMLESGAAAPLAEITLLARDGRQFTAEMHTRLIDFEGQRAILGVFMDVTERRQMQARLLQADRLASVGLLAAGVAHEMNNPLSYVIANLDFVTEHLSRRKARDPESAEPPVDAASLEELEEILREARSGAERVKVIVKDLRTFSRTDEETGTPTDLHPVLESTVNMAFKAIRTEARIVKDYGKTPLVAGNEARLGQVFMNLLQNAAQALDSARPGGNEIRLSTRTDDSGRACIEISDTGQGIDEMTLPRVFDPFFTTKPVGLGTGLGLSICRNLLEALGGEISITSRPGEGTTVRVLLPAAEAVAPARSRPGEAPSGAPLPRSRVLVVDDDPALGASLKRGLAEFHDVDVVVGGDEAIALLRENPAFDVILCDVMMPGRSGGEVYETLRAEKPELAQRFVFMTGGAFTEKARLFLERVDNPVIEKPFDLAHIRTFLGTFARHRA